MVPDPVRGAYAGAGFGWAVDASAVYAPLAGHLVARIPIPLDGLLVLDAGAGTGVAGSVLAALGARPVESDSDVSMLGHDRGRRSPAAAADVAALPFRARVFDAAVAAFVLNHVASPAAALAELARVTRPGGFVLASTFAASRAAAKEAFDVVARRHGWTPPGWHAIAGARQAAFSTVDQVRRAALAAGLGDAVVAEAAVDVGIAEPRSIVLYRLAMPQYAAWLSALDDETRRSMVAEAITAIEDLDEPFHPRVVELVARVVGHGRAGISHR